MYTSTAPKHSPAQTGGTCGWQLHLPSQLCLEWTSSFIYFHVKLQVVPEEGDEPKLPTV